MLIYNPLILIAVLIWEEEKQYPHIGKLELVEFDAAAPFPKHSYNLLILAMWILIIRTV